MATLKIHHIGYLVKKIEKAKQGFKVLGYHTEQDTVYDSIRKVEICFMTKDDCRIELGLSCFRGFCRRRSAQALQEQPVPYLL